MNFKHLGHIINNLAKINNGPRLLMIHEWLAQQGTAELMQENL